MSDVRTPFRVVAPAGGGGWSRLLKASAVCALVLLLAYPFYWWFIKRVEVEQNKLLVLINKGDILAEPTMPPEYGDQVVLYPELVSAIAKSSGWSEEQVRENYPGVRFEVFKEGRYFVSPIYHQREVVPTTIIPAGKFGVKIRKYGKPLPPGQTVARKPDERGPVAGTLEPGRHDINPLAYDVEVFDQIVIPDGFMGVQTNLSGPDPVNPDEYVVKAGERGVQPDTLGPGTYRNLNVYEVRVDKIDMRSQKYDMLREDSIEFPSNDGFTIHMEMTVEWAPYPERAPWMLVEVGDLEDVVNKVIRPYTMSLARIEGSKLTARDFIAAREEFQRRLITDLSHKCQGQGILIKSAVVRDLKPPEAIRSVIRERELADQTIKRYENEISEAKARASLVEQQELAAQNQAIGDGNKQVVTLTVNADQNLAVAVTEANKRLDVAKLELEASRKDGAAILSRGEADAKVILFGYQAEAEPLRLAVQAFGDGRTYAQFQLYSKLAPAIKSIVTGNDGPIGDILRGFAPSGAAAAPRRVSEAPAKTAPAVAGRPPAEAGGSK